MQFKINNYNEMKLLEECSQTEDSSGFFSPITVLRLK